MPESGKKLSGLRFWVTAQQLDYREHLEDKYLDKLKTITELCGEDAFETMPILQSYGNLDPYLSKIWFDESKPAAIRIFNQLEGDFDKDVISKHLCNGDIVTLPSGSEKRSASVILVPADVMGRLNEMQGKERVKDEDYQEEED